jgi:nucleotide sugar dehydrogenase
MLKIGIVGFGIVGKATKKALRNDVNISILDPAIGHTDDISYCDIIFICINETDYTMCNLIELIDSLAKQNGACIFAIRTTVIPRTTDRMTIRHKREFVFIPEFLREWNAEEDSEKPDKMIIGTENRDTFRIFKALFSNIPSEKIIQVKPIEAELAKVALNSLALIKVVFAEELNDLAKTLSADYENIYKVFSLDQNINKRHLTPNKGNYKGASGKCLPKDAEFLIKLGKNNSKMALLETAEILNNLFLRGK